MNNKIKVIWDMYWIMLTLKEEYDTKKIKEDFVDFARKEINKISEKAIEWLVDDETASILDNNNE